MYSHAKLHFVLFFVTLIYAVTFTVAKDVMPSYLGSMAFVTIRIAGALILFVCIAPFEHKILGKSGKLQKVSRSDLPKLALASLFGVAANMSFFFKGLSLTTPINASVLMLNTPIFVIIIAFFLGAEKLSVKKIVGIITAALGAGLLMSVKDVQFSSQTLLGDFYVTINAIFYALYLVYVKRLLEKYTLITVSKWTFFWGLLMVLPFGIPELTQVEFTTLSSAIVLEIIFVVLFTTFLAYLLNAWAIHSGGAILVGTYIYLQPLLAGLIAVALGKDHLSTIKFISALLIFVGVYWASRKKHKKSAP